MSPLRRLNLPFPTAVVPRIRPGNCPGLEPPLVEVVGR